MMEERLTDIFIRAQTRYDIGLTSELDFVSRICTDTLYVCIALLLRGKRNLLVVRFELAQPTPNKTQ